MVFFLSCQHLDFTPITEVGRQWYSKDCPSSISATTCSLSDLNTLQRLDASASSPKNRQWKFTPYGVLTCECMSVCGYACLCLYVCESVCVCMLLCIMCVLCACILCVHMFGHMYIIEYVYVCSCSFCVWMCLYCVLVCAHMCLYCVCMCMWVC